MSNQPQKNSKLFKGLLQMEMDSLVEVLEFVWFERTYSVIKTHEKKKKTLKISS